MMSSLSLRPLTTTSKPSDAELMGKLPSQRNYQKRKESNVSRAGLEKRARVRKKEPRKRVDHNFIVRGIEFAFFGAWSFIRTLEVSGGCNFTALPILRSHIEKIPLMQPINTLFRVMENQLLKMIRFQLIRLHATPLLCMCYVHSIVSEEKQDRCTRYLVVGILVEARSVTERHALERN